MAQGRISLPDRLVSGRSRRRFWKPPSQHGDGQESALPRSSGGWLCGVSQHGEFDLGGPFRGLASQAGERRQAPGDHGAQGHGALQALGLSQLQGFDPAPGLEDPEPVFDAPAQAIPLQHLQGPAVGRPPAGWSAAATPRVSRPAAAGSRWRVPPTG